MPRRPKPRKRSVRLCRKTRSGFPSGLSLRPHPSESKTGQAGRRWSFPTEPSTVYSVEKVGDEIMAVGDALSDWAEARGKAFFLPPDAIDFPSWAAVSPGATNQHYDPSAISTFLQVADYYLVAQSHARKHVVVTHEVPSGSIRKINLCWSQNQVYDALRNAPP